MNKKRTWTRLVKQWQRRLWLGLWRLDISFGKAEKRGQAEREGNDIEGAAIEYSPSYKKAQVTLNLAGTAGKSEKELDAMACHEMTHLLVGPLNVFAKSVIEELPKAKRDGYEQHRVELNEQVTSDIERILLYSVRGWRDG